MNTTNKLRAFFLFLILLGYSYAATAQDYKIEGNEIVKTKTAKAKTEPTKTQLTHTVKGVKYPVYQGAKGAYFIVRVSKKTGKEYKQYLKTEI